METRELTERQRGLLTLLTDRIIRDGMSMDVHHNENWLTNATYIDSDIQRFQGVLDRIGKIEYHKAPMVDDEKHDYFNPCYLGDEFYGHTIRVSWLELYGKGDEEIAECLRGMYLQDKAGRWHAPCDTGMWVSLYHPTEQRRFDNVSDCWNMTNDDRPYWRPVYNYTDVEVIEALKIMCETFGWEFEVGEDMTTMILRHSEDE